MFIVVGITYVGTKKDGRLIPSSLYKTRNVDAMILLMEDGQVGARRYPMGQHITLVH